jgi:alpha-beta hydrolase superfamily lysophospholipase
VQELAAATRSRAVGYGIDPNEYEVATRALTEPADWTARLTQLAESHAKAGDRAARAGHLATAAAELLSAARWAHAATLWPGADRAAHARGAALAAASYRRSLGITDPAATWIADTAGDAPFAGVLRRPPGITSPSLVLLVSGLDSSKEEFDYVTSALLDRGLAVLAFDGPGQGELAASTVIQPRYENVITHALDTMAERGDLDVAASRAGVIGLSLGGYYAIRGAVFDPRIRAAAIVSGVSALPWASLPDLVTETLTRRCGDAAAAREFAGSVDAAQLAARVAAPLLVIAGGCDPIPTPAQARSVAASAARGEFRCVEDGDHLIANRQWQWISLAADWLADHLGATEQ